MRGWEEVPLPKPRLLRGGRKLLNLLHKSGKGEAFADKNPDFTDKFRRKCFAPTGKNRLLAEVYGYGELR
jgi:hypothetical protein